MSPRLGGAADEAALDALYESTRRAEFEAQGLPPPLVATMLGLQARARRQMLVGLPARREWLIERAARPAAHLVLSELASELRIIDLRVSPEHRGQGLGKALLELALREADAAGQPLALNVEHGNPAREWYLRHGFVPTGTATARDEGLRRPATSQR